MNIRSVFLALVFGLLILSGLLSGCSREEDDGMVEGKYDFPIKPGSEAWKRLDSHQAMAEACQIPEKTLRKMSTEGLIDTYFDYPLLFTIFAFNNTNDGLWQIADEFNGFSELLRRKDCATRLLRKYKLIDPVSIHSMLDSISMGLFMQKIQCYELTLGFEPLYNKLTEEERRETVRLALEKMNAKEENDYSSLSKVTGYYLIAKMLEMESYPPFVKYVSEKTYLKGFLSGYLIQFMSTDATQIQQMAKDYLNQ